MEYEAIEALARTVETGPAGNPAWEREVLGGLKSVFAGVQIDPAMLTSTEAAFALACTVFPAWKIELHGPATATAGIWDCTIREGGTRDDDEVIGIGRGATIPLALTAAMVLAAARRAQGYV
ncbi:MAG: hypothetical protein C0524_10530 [Rhodobacter sp.]|nr:hypothetical protein [Rhodobacter sp.]